jgi:hypothetical protein
MKASAIRTFCFIVFTSVLLGQDEAILPPLATQISTVSEDVQLPQELTAKVAENGSLKIAVDSFNVPYASEVSQGNVTVELMNLSGQKKLALIDAEGVAIFENVDVDQLHALKIDSPLMHAVLVVMPLSPSAAEERKVTSDKITVPVIPNTQDEIQKVLASYTGFGLDGATKLGTLYGPPEVQQQSDSMYSVRLTPEGSLNGIVIVPEKDLDRQVMEANITLMNGTRVVSQISSQGGRFSFANVIPGDYAVIAAGPVGYSAFSIEVIGSDDGMKASNAKFDARYVAMNAAASQATVVLVPPTLMPQVVSSMQTSSPSTTASLEPTGSGPVPPGLPGTPGGGFPGTGGGGGAIGGAPPGGLLRQYAPLLALGAVGGVAAALADDEDNDFNNTPVSTPVGP